MPAGLLPGWLVEALARSGAMAIGALREGRSLHVESRLRGALLSSRYRATGLVVGRRVEFDGSRIALGNGVRLYGDSYLAAGGTAGSIQVGAGSEIDRNTVLYGHGGIVIGERCAIASSVTIYSQTNQYRQRPLDPVMDQPIVFEAVSVGAGVWIGAGATILPGVALGEHSVIAAGSVVTSDVDPWQVVAGVPARTVRDRRDLT